MKRLQAITSLLLGLMVPAALTVAACGGDDDDGSAGPSGGGRSGSGGKGGSSGNAGAAEGGSDQGGAPGAGGEGGARNGGMSNVAGAAGAEAGGGSGGSADAGPGTQFVEKQWEIYSTACECMVDMGAYDDIYACLVDNTYSVYGEHNAACLDDLAQKSSFVEFYIGCVNDIYDELIECYQDDVCGELVGNRVACEEGGMATSCDGSPECEDGSDEDDCPAYFSCDGGDTEIPPARVCDGQAQCTDETDEEDCPATCQSLLNSNPCGTPSDEDSEKITICTSL